jgi:class 3 adenylate cyclase
MTILTFYALFGDDIRMLAFSISADLTFYSLSFVCFFFFGLELILSSIFKPGYLNSFYFWLDLVACISLIPDIGFIWNPMLGTDDGSSGGSGAKQIQSAGKVSRAGTRTSRVLRIIRLIRLIRLVKLYKNAQKAIEAREKDASKVADENTAQLPLESRVGKRLSDLTIKRVILLVLCLLLFLPLFEIEFYVTVQTSYDYGAKVLAEFRGEAGFETVYQEYKDYHDDGEIRPLFYLSYEQLGRAFTWDDDQPKNYRNEEKAVADQDKVVGFFDLRAETRLSAGLNICKTVFVLIVLTLGALFFTSDATNLVITPIEKMIKKVQRIAENPMRAKTDKSVDELYAFLNKPEGEGWFSKICRAKKDKTEYETQLIENTIIKIGVLLALGFGEAGSMIIGSNLAKAGDIDLMITGSRVMAVFGFCDIRNFTDSTEILQEKVMVFVNEIGKVVHSIVDKHQGAPNKNIGDAFLLVWKLEEDDVIRSGNEVEINPESMHARYLADLSLLAFMKICAKVNRYPEILKYRNHVKLNERMPNYQVKMGFGLHVGWAIEGAIGSEFKIDASYLSPNVNMASKLEEKTKAYGVPLLISGDAYNLMTEEVQEYCRKVDIILVNNLPMNLYTADMDYSLLTPKVALPTNHLTRAELKRKLSNGEVTPIQLYRRSKDIRKMRERFVPEFFENFSTAFNAYATGDWETCRYYLDICAKYQPNDGPSVNLLKIMQDSDFKVPEGWQGYITATGGHH